MGRASDIFVPHRSLVNRGICCSCFETAEVVLRDSQGTSAMGLICATPEDMTTWREGLRHLCRARQLGRTSPGTRFFCRLARMSLERRVGWFGSFVGCVEGVFNLCCGMRGKEREVGSRCCRCRHCASCSYR